MNSDISNKKCSSEMKAGATEFLSIFSYRISSKSKNTMSWLSLMKVDFINDYNCAKFPQNTTF